MLSISTTWRHNNNVHFGEIYCTPRIAELTSSRVVFSTCCPKIIF